MSVSVTLTFHDVEEMMTTLAALAPTRPVSVEQSVEILKVAAAKAPVATVPPTTNDVNQETINDAALAYGHKHGTPKLVAKVREFGGSRVSELKGDAAQAFYAAITA